jgi:hypothetical protein
MKTRVVFLSALILAGASVPALAVVPPPSCENYTTAGSQCTRTVMLGWATAGLGTQAAITLFNPAENAAAVTYQFTSLNTSIGAAYSGPLGFMVSRDQLPFSIVSLVDQGPIVLQPGQGTRFLVTQICFDLINCTTAPPAGLVPNMFSAKLSLTAGAGVTLDKAGVPLMVVQFLNGSTVTFQTQETSYDVALIHSAKRAELNEGATPAGRYISNGTGGVTLPYTAFTITNPSPTVTAQVSISVNDFGGSQRALANLPPIPPLSALGYLLVGRFNGDSLGLLPFDSTVFPSGADGVFHGVYSIVSDNPVIFLSEEFWGNSMLNALIEQ